MLEPSFDNIFASYLYTSYWQVSEFLTYSDPRSSYSPKFAWQVMQDNIFVSKILPRYLHMANIGLLNFKLLPL